MENIDQEINIISKQKPVTLKINESLIVTPVQDPFKALNIESKVDPQILEKIQSDDHHSNFN